MKATALTGRVLFSLIFIMTVLSHFRSSTIDWATSKGVPYANYLVPFSSILAIAGGLMIALGFRAKAGAWLLVLFLVPVTFFMHAFWRESDTMMREIQSSHFLKNVSLLGGALLIAYFGAGPLSFDQRRLLPGAMYDDEVQQALNRRSGVRVEDTKDKIKVDA